jgi:N-acyl-L-homoserine lactone synthetase
LLCHCVTPGNRARYSRQLEDMHRQRHQFFVEKKGWSELRRPDGLDIDPYDAEETVYFLVLGDMGEVFASCRINPTWSRHQLEIGGPLRERFAAREVPCGPKVWECSRLLGGDSRRGREHATETFVRVMVAIGEFCRRRSVAETISILETSAIAMFQTAGYRCEPLGIPTRYDTANGPADALAVIIRRAGGASSAQLRSSFDFPGPAMVEAPSVRDDTNAFAPFFPLLESAMEITTEAGRKVALEMIHSVLSQEVAVGFERQQRLKA